MRRITVAIMLAVIGGLLPALTAPAQAYDRGDFVKRSDQLMFSLTLSQFMNVKRNMKRGIDDGLDWQDNGCSTPAWAKISGDVRHYNRKFSRACKRHDFGFANYGHGRQIRPTEQARQRINHQFRRDMFTICGTGRLCRKAARSYAHMVNSLRYASDKFYDGACDGGYLCLYDDNARRGWRVQTNLSISNFRSYGNTALDNNVKSVWNRSRVRFRVFEYAGYSGRNTCVTPGEVDDFGRYDGLNDELSSARRGC